MGRYEVRDAKTGKIKYYVEEKSSPSSSSSDEDEAGGCLKGLLFIPCLSGTIAIPATAMFWPWNTNLVPENYKFLCSILLGVGSLVLVIMMWIFWANLSEA